MVDGSYVLVSRTRLKYESVNIFAETIVWRAPSVGCTASHRLAKGLNVGGKTLYLGRAIRHKRFKPLRACEHGFIHCRHDGRTELSSFK